MISVKERLKRKAERMNKPPKNSIQFSNDFVRSDLKNKYKALYLYFYCRAKFKDTLLEDYKSFTVSTEELASVLEINCKDIKDQNKKVKQYLKTLQELELIIFNQLETHRFSILVKQNTLNSHFVLLPVSVINNKNVPLECLPLYAVIKSYAYNKFSTPSIDTLCNDTHQSRRVIVSQIKTLEELKIIRVFRADKRVNKYLVPDIEELQETLEYAPRIAYLKVVPLKNDMKKESPICPNRETPKKHISPFTWD